MITTVHNPSMTPQPHRLRSGLLAWVQPGETRELDLTQSAIDALTPKPAPAGPDVTPRPKRRRRPKP